MPKATLTSKGQITIPKSIRQRLGLRPGDRLDFTLDGNGVLVVEPLGPDEEPRSLAGFLEDRIQISKPVTIEEMDRAMREYVAEGVMRSLRGSDAADNSDRS